MGLPWIGRAAGVRRGAVVACAAVAASVLLAGAASAHTHHARRGWVKPGSAGALDCNGMSPIQSTIESAKACTDIRGILNSTSPYMDDGHFYDNGRYIGHDEPIMRFLSGVDGSGNDITWRETLPLDPAAPPDGARARAGRHPLVRAVIAPWFSMALCNRVSYPLMPCKPKSDANAPVGNARRRRACPAAAARSSRCSSTRRGMAPFVGQHQLQQHALVRVPAHQRSRVHVDFASCNTNCEEPTNFAFIQTNGVPTGPPSPQLANLATQTPNAKTLMMNPGDRLVIHIWDARARRRAARARNAIHGHDDRPERVHARLCREWVHGHEHQRLQRDAVQLPARVSTRRSRRTSCRGRPTGEHRARSSRSATSSRARGSPSRSTYHARRPFTDTSWKRCHGPYENDRSPGRRATPEPADAPCYPGGDTHRGTAPPNVVTGCVDDFFQNGDLDFDGTSYWPTGRRDDAGPFPSPFQQQFADTPGPRLAIQFQTDAPHSESELQFPTGRAARCRRRRRRASSTRTGHWRSAAVLWEFGNMANGNTFGKQAQYGRSTRSWDTPSCSGRSCRIAAPHDRVR